MFGLPPLEQRPVTMLEAAPCHLGEGPTYDPASGTAWWFDILERRLHEADLSQGSVRVHDLPVMASALAFLEDGRQLLVAEDGLHLCDPGTGVLERRHAVPPQAVPFRSNDARVHPSGTLWFSTMGRKAEAGQAVIWALHGGRIERLFGGITIPNAICFSPDGATGYFSDTRQNTLMRVALDPASGLPAGEPTLLLHQGRYLRGAMREHRITEPEILAALRNAGAADPRQVAAVVLESDGSLSVIQDAAPDGGGSLANLRGSGQETG